jgi:K+-sensing histidine kinase KdpD
MTHIRRLIQAEQENLKFQLRESTVSHELLTPLKCIAQMSKDMFETQDARIRADCLKDNPQLIFNTAKLLLAQMNDILDNRLLDQPNY